MNDQINCNDNNYLNLSDARLTEIAIQLEELLSHEEKMLHPPIEVIKESIKRGLAAMCFDEHNNLIGFCRLIPVLGREHIGNNQWNPNLPDIYELGTVIVHPAHRGKGHGKELLTQLHERFKDQLINEEVLFMGTTTTYVMIKALGLNFANTFNVGYMKGTPDGYLGASTCVCEPTHPPYGTGIQMKEECNNRLITENDIPVAEVTQDQMTAGKCVMFFSNSNVAQRLELLVSETFGQPSYENRRRFANILNWNPEVNIQES